METNLKETVEVLYIRSFVQQETMQIQKRQEINRTYGLSRSNSFMGEIPDEEFKVFMAIARCLLHSGPYVSMGYLL